MRAASFHGSSRSLPCAIALLGMLGACHVPAVPGRTCSIDRPSACSGGRSAPAVLHVVVHAVNQHHASVTAPEIVAIANERLAIAAIELRVVETVVHGDLPASWAGQSLSRWAVPGAVDVFIFLSVEGRTAEGAGEVQGSHLGDGTIVISGSLGTWDTLAHEVGHMLGLTHTGDSANVMGEDRIWRSEFTPAQARMMRRSLRAPPLEVQPSRAQSVSSSVSMETGLTR